MKKLINITRCASGILYTFAVLFLIECSFSSCADHELEITRNFPFEIAVMPVQKGIAIGETVEIRCSIATSGNYTGTHYSMRYFQSDGKGSLRIFDNPALIPNDTYPLQEKEFRLYYTSESTVSQSFDIWISDNMGNEQKLSFQFNPQNVGTL